MSELLVGMGEIAVSGDSNTVITALGLGSCVGLFVYDYKALVAGCAHVVLPNNRIDDDEHFPAKGMNTAFDRLVDAVYKITKCRPSLSWALVGGAQLFSGLAPNSVMNIGARNIAAAEKQIAQRGIQPIFTDFGGDKGRTARLCVGEGTLYLRRLGESEQAIADMRHLRTLQGVHR